MKDLIKTTWLLEMNKQYIYEENQQGKFFVHDACIACDTCTDIAPNHFKLTTDYDHAYVSSQPTTKSETLLCNEALDACPVAAIGNKND